MSFKRFFLGEILGTFILVFIGCGSVSLAISYEIIHSLIEVALFWTFGVILGIYASLKLSGAHLNPAVSIAMLVDKQLTFKKFLLYTLAQIIGAVFAGLLLFLIIRNDINSFDLKNASIFGEYFPNPSYENLNWVTLPIAFSIELTATFVLIFLIFIITGISSLQKLSPTLIGITVGILIYIVAPYTQCCMNPARDFGPRLISYFNGWSEIAFNYNGIGWLIVYILGPLTGGALAAIVFKLTLKKSLS